MLGGGGGGGKGHNYDDMTRLGSRFEISVHRRLHDPDMHDSSKPSVKEKRKSSSLGGLEPPTFRLTAERANRLRHRDNLFVLPKRCTND